MKPKFKHDCDLCKYIGSFNIYNKYYDIYDASHQMAGIGSGIVVRYGNSDSDYWSGDNKWFAEKIDHLIFRLTENQMITISDLTFNNGENGHMINGNMYDLYNNSSFIMDCTISLCEFDLRLPTHSPGGREYEVVSFVLESPNRGFSYRKEDMIFNILDCKFNIRDINSKKITKPIILYIEFRLDLTKYKFCNNIFDIGICEEYNMAFYFLDTINNVRYHVIYLTEGLLSSNDIIKRQITETLLDNPYFDSEIKEVLPISLGTEDRIISELPKSAVIERASLKNAKSQLPFPKGKGLSSDAQRKS